MNMQTKESGRGPALHLRAAPQAVALAAQLAVGVTRRMVWLGGGALRQVVPGLLALSPSTTVGKMVRLTWMSCGVISIAS